MANNLSDVGYVGYGIEGYTTEGTIVAPTLFLPASAFSVESNDADMTPSQLRGNRDKTILLSGPYSVSGSMDMEFSTAYTTPLLVSALSAYGGVATSSYSGGGYQHILTPGNVSPTFSFEASAGDILVMRYGGIRVNTFEIKAAFGEIVTASFGLEGTTRAKQGSASSPYFAQVQPLHFTGASVKINGSQVATVKNFSFTAGNNIERIGTLQKTRSWRRTALGMRDLGFTATMDFTDTTDYDLFLAQTEFAVQLHMEGPYISGSSGPRHTLVIDLARCKYNTINAPLQAGSFIEQSVVTSVVRPLSGAAIGTITVVTTDATSLVPGA